MENYMEVYGALLKLNNDGKIDDLEFRYYSRLISSADDVINSGKRKMDLKKCVGKEVISHVISKRQS